MTYHSNLKEKLFLMIALSWGLRIKKSATPFFVTNKNGKEITFYIEVLNHRNSELELTAPKKDADYAIVIIPNKRGDNLILFKFKELFELPDHTFESLAKKLIFKERIDISHGD